MTRPFIDKKKALKFRLVQRSVKDDDLSVAISGDRVYQPLNEASARHLANLEAQAVSERQKLTERVIDESEGLERDLSNLEISSSIVPGESAKYGIYFDDRSYDYVQHLKPIKEGDADAVFIESVDQQNNEMDYEEDEDEEYYHLKNEEVIDPAIKECLEALDDEAYEDADFEDDFVVRLNQNDTAVLCPMEVPKKSTRFAPSNKTYMAPSESESEDEDDGFIYRDDKDEVLTMASSFRGTTYAPSMAMTSIDNKFEIVLQEYEDDFDNLDDEDVYSEASIDEEILAEALEEFNQNEYQFVRASVDDRKNAAISMLEEMRREMGPLTEAILNREESSEEELSDPFLTSDEEDEKFDCQSIAATLCNTENIPHVIREQPKYKREGVAEVEHIRLSRRGIPIIPSDRKESKADHEEEDDDAAPKENKGAARSQQETPEEKKARKSAIKAERRDKRAQKKNLKVRFKTGDV